MLKVQPHGHADEILLELYRETDATPKPATSLELTFRLTPDASADLRRQLKRAETMLANRRRVRAPRSP